jgi:hypothetical protein
LDAANAKLDLLKVVEVLTRHNVEYMVIGGQAAYLHGSPLVTLDTDLCFRRTSENLERMAAALREMNPTLRGAPPDLPFRLDAQSLALGADFMFNTDFGSLDILGRVEPFESYNDLIGRAAEFDVGIAKVKAISLDDKRRFLS